jgi:hypothetical protein
VTSAFLSCKNEVVQAQFMLVFDAQMFDADAPKWWSDLAQMDRAEFEERAADLVGRHGGAAGDHRNERCHRPLGYLIVGYSK